MPLLRLSRSKPLRWVRVDFGCKTGNNSLYTAAMLEGGARVGRSIPALVLFAMTRYNKTISGSKRI